MTTTENTTRPFNNTITRRKMLQSVAAVSMVSLTPVAIAGASAASFVAPSADPAETPELIAALEALSKARATVSEIENDMDWLEAEWRHRWPLAPEEILGAANCHFHRRDNTVIETDILGRPLMRETSELTKRLSKKWRQENERTCFALNTPEALQREIQDLRSKSPRGRTEKTIAKDQARLKKWIEEDERALLLSEAYFAEIARLRQLSGVEALKKRLAEAKAAVVQGYENVAFAPANSALGLRAKALAYIADGGKFFKDHHASRNFLLGGYHLAMNVVKTTHPTGGEEWALIADAFHDILADLAMREASV